MQVKFCHVLCYKRPWYFLATSISCIFSCTNNTLAFSYFFVTRSWFNKVNNPFIKSAYYSICDDYVVNGDETSMYGDWLYTRNFGIFRYGIEATKRSPPDNIARGIIAQFKDFTKGIEKVSRSARAYAYLALTSQIQARSSIVGNSVSAVDAQQVFKSTFKALMKTILLVLILTDTRVP